MAVQPDVIRTPVPDPQRRRRLASDDSPRRSSGPGPRGVDRPAAPLGQATHATARTPGRSGSGSGAAALLILVPLCGALAVTAAVVVVNAVNAWWAIVPGMLISLIATVCVLAAAIRMLADGD